MSARALAWAWQQQPKTTTQKLVLAALADRADDDGECFPSIDWLAQKCAPISSEHVRRTLRELAAQGFVAKAERRRRSDGQLSTWIYRLPLADPATGHPRTVEPPGTHARAEDLDLDQDLSVEPEGSTAVEVIDGSAEVTSRDLVANFVDGARELDLPLAKKVIGQVARQVKALLDEGHPPDRVRAGLEHMIARRTVRPELLANFMLEAALPERPPPRRRYGYGVRDDELGDLQRRLEEEGR